MKYFVGVTDNSRFEFLPNLRSTKPISSVRVVDY